MSIALITLIVLYLVWRLVKRTLVVSIASIILLFCIGALRNFELEQFNLAKGFFIVFGMSALAVIILPIFNSKYFSDSFHRTNLRNGNDD